MFTVERLSAKIDELVEGRIDLEAFEDWFVSESWGHFDVQGGLGSSLIAAVHHVFHRYGDEDIDDRLVGSKLADAVRPFLRRDIVVVALDTDAGIYHRVGESKSASGDRKTFRKGPGLFIPPPGCVAQPIAVQV